MNRISIVLTLLVVSGSASGQEAHRFHSAYAGEESRAVKSLSREDIAELRRGGGWGLAKTAELNGIPGPVHLLERADQMPLTPAQVKAITAVYKQMRAEAIAEGERYIAHERDSRRHFAPGRSPRRTCARCWATSNGAGRGFASSTSPRTLERLCCSPMSRPRVTTTFAAIAPTITGGGRRGIDRRNRDPFNVSSPCDNEDGKVRNRESSLRHGLARNRGEPRARICRGERRARDDPQEPARDASGPRGGRHGKCSSDEPRSNRVGRGA